MEYFVHVAILICFYGILALSLNLVVGETGLLSVAQAAFAGIGAYVTAIVLTTTNLGFPLAVCLSMGISAAVALVIGVVFARLKDVYYAFGTIGLSVIMFSIFSNWVSMTKGPLGIAGIPRPSFFRFALTDNTAFLLLALLALTAVYGVCRFISASSFGRTLNAIREDEGMTAVFGYRILSYKVTIFAISAALAALAGSLFATYISYISPVSFQLFESVLVLAIVILGGVGSSRGALVGAVIMVVLPEALRFAGFPSDIAAQLRQVVYGGVLILVVLYRPQGILGRFRI